MSKKYDAVWQVLNKHGDRTNVSFIQQQAQQCHPEGEMPHYAYCVQIRSLWRKERGITRDCRRNDDIGQPRRNMDNDRRVSKGALETLERLIPQPKTLLAIKALIEEHCHSHVQLCNMIDHLVKKSNYSALGAHDLVEI